MAVDIASLAIRVDSRESDQAAAALNSLTRSGGSAESAMNRLGSASASAASQLAQVVGITLSLAGAFYMAERAASSWYRLISGGVSIVDDYQKKIISTSYILTTMSEVEPPDLSRTYGQWKDYFDWLYRESLRVDKMAAASAQEIFSVSVEMAKKGVVATTEEQVDTIGRLTDLMKAVTPGYMNFEQQARGEIQALMEGTARMGAQTAQILSQIDPEFKKNIANARATKTELEYIRSILPQIKQYTLDLMGTWDAVGASLKSAWSVINIKAFGDAHREIVALATELSNRLVDNGRLTETGEKAARALSLAWTDVRERVVVFADYFLNNSDRIIGDLGKIASAAATVAGWFLDAASFAADIVHALEQIQRTSAEGISVKADWSNFPGLENVAPTMDPFLAAAQQAQKEAGGVPPVPSVRRFTDKETGNKSLESAEKSVRSFVESMNQATAAGAGDTEAILAAWKQKQLQTLSELAAKGADISQAKLALNQAVDAKQRKLDADFTDWYTAQMGHQLGALQAAEEKKLRKVAGNEVKTAQVREAYALKYALLQNEQEQQRLSLAKGYLDQFSQLLPGLSEQLRYKQMVLDAEKQITAMQLQQQLLQNKITADVYDQGMAAQALVNQLKQFQLDQEKLKTGGLGAGLQLWGYQRGTEGATATTQGVISFMKDIESGLSSGLSGALINTMKGQKTSIEETFMNAVASGVQKGFDWITGQLFTSLAKLFYDPALNAVAPLVYGGQTAGGALFTGGQQAGVALINAAIQAQAILSGGSSAGMFTSSMGSGATSILSSIDWGAFYSGTPAVPFAEGGIVTRPTLGMIAESGRPEAVIPLDKLQGPQVNIIIQNNSSSATAKSGGTTAGGDPIIVIDDMVAQAVNRRGSTFKAIQTAGKQVRR